MQVRPTRCDWVARTCTWFRPLELRAHRRPGRDRLTAARTAIWRGVRYMSAAEREPCTAPPSLRQLDRPFVTVPRSWPVVCDWPSRGGQARRSRVLIAAVSRPGGRGRIKPRRAARLEESALRGLTAGPTVCSP